VTGFEGSCAFEQVSQHDTLILNFKTENKRGEIIVPVHCSQLDEAARKSRKLERISDYLKCPRCRCTRLVLLKKPLNTLVARIQRGGLIARLLLLVMRVGIFNSLLRSVKRQVFRYRGQPPPETDYLICPACHAVAVVNDRHFNFLSKDVIKSFDIIQTDNISANCYDGLALNTIYKYRNGLILDCGAGLRKECYENVINYEIVAYDSTDVLGVAERLPFKDNTFDGVFSFAVLEHVKDPFAGAREMVRVLKPGGMLYCQAPFLAPLHGYPHHYFNMSKQGLNLLFEGLIDIDRLEVLNFGQPIFALSWFLNSYITGLPEEQQEAFREMKIRDLIKPGGDYLGASFVRELSDDFQDILSCCNCLIGKKR